MGIDEAWNRIARYADVLTLRTAPVAGTKLELIQILLDEVFVAQARQDVSLIARGPTTADDPFPDLRNYRRGVNRWSFDRRIIDDEEEKIGLFRVGVFPGIKADHSDWFILPFQHFAAGSSDVSLCDDFIDRGSE